MPDYRIFAVDIEKEKSLVLEIWRRNQRDPYRVEQKYDWHFRNNPCGPGQCWILEADGRPAGTASLGMREIEAGGSTFRAGLACDLAVDETHRLLLPAILLQKQLLASIGDSVRFAYGLPSAGGAAVMRRAGYREVFPVHRYARALRLSPYLARDRRLAWSVPVVGRAADCAYATFCSPGKRASRPYVAVVMSDFDERFDVLWSRVKSRHGFLTVRSRRFLQWRYRDCPLHDYRTIGLLSPDRSELLGYVVYYAGDGIAIGADILCGGGDREIDCLLAAWIRDAWQLGLTGMSAACSAGDSLRQGLLRRGFSQRSAVKPAGPAATKAREASPAVLAHQTVPAAAGAMAAWYFTYGDQPY